MEYNVCETNYNDTINKLIPLFESYATPMETSLQQSKINHDKNTQNKTTTTTYIFEIVHIPREMKK